MALTNAEKQKRWRERRNELARALIGDAPWIAQQIFSELGAKKTRRVVDLLRKRLKAIDPNCQLCKGTGFTPTMEIRGPCGGKEGEIAMPCPCDPAYTAAAFENGRKWAEGEKTQDCSGAMQVAPLRNQPATNADASDAASCELRNQPDPLLRQG
jgi:hypothetical protein